MNFYFNSVVKLLASRNNLWKLTRKMAKEMPAVFLGEEDIHNGVIINSITNPCNNINEFKSKLQASLKKWLNDHRRAIWFKINVSQADWIPVLAENGFRIHNGAANIVTMVRWLPKNEIDRVPVYAHTMVGVGAVVFNGDNQLLVVRERYRQLPFWKLPGGYVEPKEDFVDAAVREVLEETNIRTEFEGLVTLRHTLSAAFGCSDLYIILSLKPINFDVIKQDEEIESVQWMNVSEFLTHPEVHEFNRMCVRKYLQLRENGTIFSKTVMTHSYTGKLQSVYSLSLLDK